MILHIGKGLTPNQRLAPKVGFKPTCDALTVRSFICQPLGNGEKMRVPPAPKDEWLPRISREEEEEANQFNVITQDGCYT